MTFSPAMNEATFIPGFHFIISFDVLHERMNA
ncbi:hypothetical protein T11_17498 [Trichinella zimbabwensis]|uniref:Uncharacterized protein n=1 Tax=Trichinella zimbabwensis TaxID=268475 RepID=A0A0V1DQD2_9BILA|nr:hypothetical protein T11_17498 [Trichinella zimbabwensis]